MKKKILFLLFVTLLISGFSNLYIEKANASVVNDQTTVTPTPEITPTPEVTPTPVVTPTPEATPTPIPQASMISISQLPVKVNYQRGESLDLTGLMVEAYYMDGTKNFITDYQAIGFNSEQIGPQSVILMYQNLMASFQVTVLPPKVTNLTVSYYDTTSFTLAWSYDPNATRYEIYYLNDLTGTYDFYNSAITNSATFYYPMGTSESFVVYAVENVLGVEYKSSVSDVITAATAPDAVTGLYITETGTNSITFAWNPAAGATGYLIYRSAAAEEKYVLIATTDSLTTTYKSNRLISGKSYKYKIYAYNYNELFTGGASNIADASTKPAKMVLKYKQGDQKVRFNWSKVYGATSYDIYISDQLGGYMLLNSFASNTVVSYTAEGLITGDTYSFYAIAHREYNGVVYDSPASDVLTIEIKPIDPTSSFGKLYSTTGDFLNSWIYNSMPFIKKYMNYKKSFVIPGVATTNVGGFTCTTMCPQGLTFAGDYLLSSAYDLSSVENSVIYVMDKSTKELLTTLILPNKPHLGGLAFDGFNVWVTNGSKVSTILLSDIEAAVAENLPYAYVTYSAVFPLNMITSFVTYYDGKLWVGTYNELEATNLYSFLIENADTLPTLTQVDTIVMPTRVQGIAFSEQGTLFISRSCQLYKGLRGYMRQIDVYKPLFSEAVDGIIPLGEVVNSVSMPSMNEGVAIDDGYLYVNFESAAFDKSTYKMDRICAFRMVNLVKKK